MPATPEALQAAQVAATAAEDKLATEITALDVSKHLALTDIFLIASAPNDRQVGAIVDNVEEQMRLAGLKPLRREGERSGHWVLLDFGDIVVHVMQEEDRLFYRLERLWKDCPAVPLRLGRDARSSQAPPDAEASGEGVGPEGNGASS